MHDDVYSEAEPALLEAHELEKHIGDVFVALAGEVADAVSARVSGEPVRHLLQLNAGQRERRHLQRPALVGICSPVREQQFCLGLFVLGYSGLRGGKRLLQLGNCATNCADWLRYLRYVHHYLIRLLDSSFLAERGQKVTHVVVLLVVIGAGLDHS